MTHTQSHKQETADAVIKHLTTGELTLLRVITMDVAI